MSRVAASSAEALVVVFNKELYCAVILRSVCKITNQKLVALEISVYMHSVGVPRKIHLYTEM